MPLDICFEVRLSGTNSDEYIEVTNTIDIFLSPPSGFTTSISGFQRSPRGSDVEDLSPRVGCCQEECPADFGLPRLRERTAVRCTSF